LDDVNSSNDPSGFKRLTVRQPNTSLVKEVKEPSVWLACFLHILQRCCTVDDGKFLSAWWNSEVSKRHVKFLSILAIVPEVFKYTGMGDMLPYDFSSTAPETSLGLLGSFAGTSILHIDSADQMKKSLRIDTTAKLQVQTNSSTRQRSRPQIMRGHADVDVKTYLEEHYSGLAAKSNTERPPITTPTSIGLLYPKRWAALPPYAVPSKELVVQMYQTLSLESSSIVLDIALSFSKELSEALKKTHKSKSESSRQSSKEDSSCSVELEKFFAVFLSLITKNQCDEFLVVLFSSLQFIMVKFRKQIFREHTPFCLELTKAVFRMADSKNPNVRGMSAAMLCNMIKFNNDEMSSSHEHRSSSSSDSKFSRMKLMSTVAVSEIVADRDDDLSFLTAMLDAVTKYLSHTELKKDITDLQARLVKVINDGIQMQKYKNDPETTAELFHSISKGFLDSPDLRLTWLGSLAKRHEANRNKEQAAHVKIIMAALVVKYMELVRSFPMSINEDEWAHVCPRIKDELEVPKKQVLLPVKDEICNGMLFSEAGFKKLLNEAISLLRSGANYEQCVETYQLMLQLPRATHDYAAQSLIYAELQKLCDKIVAESQASARIEPNYYRVGFYGQAFGKLDGTQYIYKETAFVRLAEFTERFKEMYKDITLTYLPNSSVVDPAKLEKDKNYLQIGAVSPFFGDVDTKGESTPSSNNIAYTNAIKEFVMSMPFTKSGKAQGDVADQWLKKIRLRTTGAFPYMLKRLRVTKQEQTDVPPVRNAIDLIADRVSALQAELNGKTINTKMLLSLMHGALLAAVNVGPLAIGRVFIDKESRAKLDPKPSSADIQELCSNMTTLDTELNNALVAVEGEIDPDQQPLLDELWNAHKSFSEEVANLCANA